MGLPAITAVLDGQRSIVEAVAAERAALDVELAALAWRRASLRALEDAGPARRAAYLELLAAVSDGRAAHDTLVGFWQRISIAEVPPPMFDDLVAMVVPDPPVDPTPEQVVAYAELVALVGDRSFLQRLAARARVNARELADEVGMLRGVSEACALADPLVRAGERPGPGQALDRFVAAHADGRRRSDTPAFRRELSVDADVDRDPRMRRYWALAGEVLGEKPDPGAPLLWLVDALEVAVRSA